MKFIKHKSTNAQTMKKQIFTQLVGSIIRKKLEEKNRRKFVLALINVKNAIINHFAYKFHISFLFIYLLKLVFIYSHFFERRIFRIFILFMAGYYQIFVIITTTYSIYSHRTRKIAYVHLFGFLGIQCANKTKKTGIIYDSKSA